MFENFQQYEYFLTAAICSLALVGMGAALTVDAFLDVAQRPRTLLLVLFCQLIVGPLLAIWLGRVFQQPPGITAGMLLITALPGGLFSNIFALLSRAHVALSISATAVCTLGSLITTTLVLQVFGTAHLPKHVEMPAGHILFEIVVCLLLPLGAGMAFRRHVPKLAKSVARWCVRGATLLLVVYVVAALRSGRIDLWAFGWTTHAAIILLAVLQVLACLVLAWPFRVTSLESFTCQLEVVVRNVHLGLLLAAVLFPAGSSGEIGNGVIFALLYYGGTPLVTGVVMVLIRHGEILYFGENYHAAPPRELQGW